MNNSTITTQPTDFAKLCEIMNWELSGETQTKKNNEAAEQIQQRGVNLAAIPNSTTLNAVWQAGAAGDFQSYAESLEVASLLDLKNALTKTMQKTILDPVFSDKNTKTDFAPLYNFFMFATSLQRRGKISQECSEVAEIVWNATTQPRNRKRNLTKFFTSEKPNLDKFCKAAEKLKDIYNFTNEDIDALRFFVCQSKHEYLNDKKFDASLNKSLYFYSKEKKTGKTTLGRIFTTLLNADTYANSDNYISTYGKEMGFSEHVMPSACLYNAVLLDEAMPRDTRKSYAALKANLTSEVYHYNPKFRQLVSVPAKRNYICTSNDPVSSFVQDETERRFYEVKFTKQNPKKMEISELEEIVSDFVLFAESEPDLLTWYNRFDDVQGVLSVKATEAESDILKNKSLIFENYKSSITSRQIATFIYKNEPTTEQKEAVTIAMSRLFPKCAFESNPRSFSIAKMRKFTITENDNGEIVSTGGEVDAVDVAMQF